MSRVHRVFLGSVAIPLIRLRLGTILAHEEVTPAEVPKLTVGVGVVAKVAVDDDLFFFVSAHVFIIGAGVKYARGNPEKRIVVSACYIRTYERGGPPLTIALHSVCGPISLPSSYTERINK